jgi:hypothetical protein
MHAAGDSNENDAINNLKSTVSAKAFYKFYKNRVAGKTIKNAVGETVSICVFSSNTFK